MRFNDMLAPCYANQKSTAEQVLAHLQLLLNTRRGSVVHLPDYGILDLQTIYHHLPDATTQLIEFKESVDSLVSDKKMKRDDAIFNILREYIKDSKRIRFEGDGYGEAWEKEAKNRGLSNNKNTPEALKEKVSKKTIALYEGLNIMSKVEIEARYEIRVEEYALRIQIEGRVLGDIARNHVIPTAIKYQNILIENVQGLKDIYGAGFANAPAGGRQVSNRRAQWR